MEEHEEGQTNLIINYLPQTMTDEEFRSIFLSIGPITNAKIVRDKATGYSYGFGFVDYQLPADALRAVQTLTGLEVQNKRIKVALARKNSENIKGANLYIKNLPIHWKESELNTVFEPYGKIIQSRVLVDLNTGVSKRVGFVLYDTRDQAEKAIQCINNTKPDGCMENLQVKFADDNSKKMQQPVNIQYIPVPNNFGGPGPMRNQFNVKGFQRFNPMAGNMNYQQQQSQQSYTLFVYNIGTNATDRTLWTMFSPYGTVQKVNIMLDHEKNICKGFGFVTMTNLTEANNAIHGLNGYYYQGRQLQVSFKQDKNQQATLNTNQGMNNMNNGGMGQVTMNQGMGNMGNMGHGMNQAMGSMGGMGGMNMGMGGLGMSN